MKKAKPTTTKKAKTLAPTVKSRQVVVKDGNRSLAKPLNFEQDARAGQESMSQADYAIPRLGILQSLSPQIDKRNERYIEGAEPGDICDTVTGTLFDGGEGLVLIPVRYRRAHIEWIPRKKGGGFVADHGTDGDIVSKCERDKDTGALSLPNGHELKIIGEYFVFMVDQKTGDTTPYVLALTGTQMKKSRRWNTMINQLRVPSNSRPGETFNPAMWYRSYKFTTVPERNDKGSWFGWNIEPDTNTVDLPHGEKIYREARDFSTSIGEGRVTARPITAEDVGAGAGAQANPEDDELPM